jgi:hypothetical protein
MERKTARQGKIARTNRVLDTPAVKKIIVKQREQREGGMYKADGCRYKTEVCTRSEIVESK